MKFDIFIPGGVINEAGKAISQMLKDYQIGKTFADMMRLRVSGQVSDQCSDTFYVAHRQGSCYSRLWNGWGRHKDAIGNFGNFMTLEECRGQGIGKQMMQLWHEDILQRPDKPLGLFCTGNQLVAPLYYGYGFRAAGKGWAGGNLYLPLGGSPETFDAFCDMYYEPSEKLFTRPACIGYRHEIDCLLRFYFMEQGLQFEINELMKIEQALLYDPNRVEMLFTESGRCVGWQADGTRRIHPRYKDVKIEHE